jgi:hypothetical protein
LNNKYLIYIYISILLVNFPLFYPLFVFRLGVQARRIPVLSPFPAFPALWKAFSLIREKAGSRSLTTPPLLNVFQHFG